MERGSVKKRERRKRSDSVLVELCSCWYCKERKKGKKVTGTIVWVERYDPVDVTVVYQVYSNSSFSVCVYWKRVKVLYPLVVTSLEGLQWWSVMLSINVPGNRYALNTWSAGREKSEKIGGIFCISLLCQREKELSAVRNGASSYIFKNGARESDCAVRRIITAAKKRLENLLYKPISPLHLHIFVRNFFQLIPNFPFN